MGGEVIICEDIEIYEDPGVGEIYKDSVVGELNEDPVKFVVEVGVECHEEDINISVDDDDIKECNPSNDNKSTAILGLNMTIGSHEAIPEVNFEDDLVEDVENCPASEFVIKKMKFVKVQVLTHPQEYQVPTPSPLASLARMT